MQVQLRRGLPGQPQPALVVLELPVRVDARLDAQLGRAELDRVADPRDELLALVRVGVGRAATLAEAAERAADDADVRHVEVAVDDERDGVAGELGTQLVGRLAHVLDHLGARLGEERRQLPGGQRPAGARAGDRVRPQRALGAVGAAGAAARDEAPEARLDDVEHALGQPFPVDEARVDAQPLGQRDAVGGEPLAHLVGRRERVLGRDVVAVGAQPAEVGGPGRDEARPPVGEVGRDLDAGIGHQPPRLGHQALHVVDGHRRRPGRGGHVRALVQAGPPVALGRLRRDRGGLLAVVAPVRDEVLQDDLLQVAEAGERLERRHAVLLGLPDADQDAAGERDLQLVGGAQRLQPQRGILRRRGLVHDEVGAQRLQHQALAGRHLAQPRQVVAAQRPEVGVRQQPALERALAAPGDVGDEVREPERGEPVAHACVMARLVAGQHQQLLDVAPRGAVEQPLDLLGLVQVRAVRRERAVLAMRHAGARQRQRDVARERDPAAHPCRSLGV